MYNYWNLLKWKVRVLYHSNGMTIVVPCMVISFWPIRLLHSRWRWLYTLVRSLCFLHHLQPAALGSVNHVETYTLVCNLYCYYEYTLCMWFCTHVTGGDAAGMVGDNVDNEIVAVRWGSSSFYFVCEFLSYCFTCSLVWEYHKYIIFICTNACTHAHEHTMHRCMHTNSLRAHTHTHTLSLSLSLSLSQIT